MESMFASAGFRINEGAFVIGWLNPGMNNLLPNVCSEDSMS